MDTKSVSPGVASTVCRAAFAGADDEQAAEERRRLAADHTYGRRAERILSVVAAARDESSLAITL